MHTEHEQKVTGGNYEREDLDPMVLIKMGTALGVMAVGTYIVSWWFVSWTGHNPAGFFLRDESRTPISENATVSRKLPPAPYPLLQDNVTAQADIVNLREKEDQLLHEGGLNSQTGKTTMPIEQAMDLEAKEHGD